MPNKRRSSNFGGVAAQFSLSIGPISPVNPEIIVLRAIT